VRPEQPAKALCPIDVTVDGISRAPLSPLQPLNPLIPIVVRDDGIVRRESPVQPPNVPVLMIVTDEGIVRFPVKPEQSWNA